MARWRVIESRVKNSFAANLAWLLLTISLTVTGQIEAASLASLSHMVHSLLEPLCQRAEHAGSR